MFAKHFRQYCSDLTIKFLLSMSFIKKCKLSIEHKNPYLDVYFKYNVSLLS